jgi:uncharacterized protein
MQLNEITYRDAVPFDSYGPGFFRVSGHVIEGPALVTLTRASSWGGLEDLAPLQALAGEVDVIFLGMGPEIAHAPAPLRNALEALGIGVEVMASPAACRTYNVLASEGRRIAAAVLPV